MLQKRSISTAIILNILTCGIYGIYWFIKLNDEINYITNSQNDTSGVMAFLLGLITCGVYNYYWMYKMGRKLDDFAVMRGFAPASRGVACLILSLFGLGVVSYAIMQDSINRMA